MLIIFDSIAQEILIYYRCKLHDTTATDRGFGGGISTGLFGATGDEQAGRSSQSSGLGEILRCVVPAGEFRTIPMPKEGGMVHDHVLYAASWFEESFRNNLFQNKARVHLPLNGYSSFSRKTA